MKTYLRIITGQEKLNGVATLNIYRDIHIDAEMVMNELPKTSKRKLTIYFIYFNLFFICFVVLFIL